MAILGGKTSTASKTKYNAKAYDQVKFVVPKGQREKIKKRAETLGMSLAEYIRNLIDKDMEN